MKRIKCNQCNSAYINGIFCHETGCPNTNSRYDAEDEVWIPVYECRECGFEVDMDDVDF